MKQPLVSIIIPNKNHSKFLGQAIESALGQTYKNIEVIVNDNCSDDNSIEVAMKYLDRGVIINKNPDDIIAYTYRVLARLVRGKYFMLLCADDCIAPTFVEKAVEIMEKDNEIGYVHCERDYIDENNNVISLDPFFKCSFKVKGEKMLPIYTMTDVAQSAQALIRKAVFDAVGRHDTEVDYLVIDRDQWFRLSMFSDYAYLREKLSYIRIHSGSETSANVNTFMHVPLYYMSIIEFLEWGRIKGNSKVNERKDMCLEKLSKDFVNIASSLIKDNKLGLAKRYLLAAKITNESICEDKLFMESWKITEDNSKDQVELLNKEDSRNITHIRSYDPPEGYIKL